MPRIIISDDDGTVEATFTISFDKKEQTVQDKMFSGQALIDNNKGLARNMLMLDIIAALERMRNRKEGGEVGWS